MDVAPGEPFPADWPNAFRQAFESSLDDFFERFGDRPHPRGQRVLDLGTGLGELAVWAALNGASEVTAVDIDRTMIAWATQNVVSNHPSLVGSIQFESGDIRRYSGEYDLAISKDTFEHVEHPADTLAALARLLRPGGEAWIGFSPLYYSPWGGHGQIGSPLPWVQTLPWPIVRRLAERKHGRPLPTANDLWLNRLTPREFRSAADAAGFEIRRIRYNRGDKPGLKIMNLLRHGILERYLTVSVYAILERP